MTPSHPGLIDLSIRHKTDKWGLHSYAQHYEHHLSRFRDRKITLLEIGIGGYEDPLVGGSSLRVWSDWLTHPDTVIIGVDIHEKKMPFSDPRVKVHQGSQVDVAFLDQLHRRYGDFDIVLDDGSHLPEHVIKTFKMLYPKTRDGGIYIIEDTQTSYWTTEHWNANAVYNSENPTYSFFKNAPDWINYAEIPLPAEVNYYELHTVAAHFYHNLIILDKDRNDEPSNLVAARKPYRGDRLLVAQPSSQGQPKMGLTVHVGLQGDVRNETAASYLTDGRGAHCIQGFALSCSTDIASSIEYRGRLQSGAWTEWIGGNSFAGTRGKGEALSGYAVRLKGDLGARFDLLTLGAFQNREGFTLARDGADCVTEDPAARLYGLQVLLLPK